LRLNIKHKPETQARAFFALGGQVARLEKLEKGRELWVAVVIIGFIVNLAAGMAVILLGN